MSDLPEPDRAPGAPHPRETQVLFGQGQAEAQFLDAMASGKLHHAWLLSGPRGTGKATLAWRIARHLLAAPPEAEDDAGPGLFGDAPAPAPVRTLDLDPEHPVSRRIVALSEPGLMLIRRGVSDDGKQLKSQITVDEVRKLGGFFGLSAAEGGRRVVIVDSADEMNTSAANALLKLLEEPPKRAVLLLISHQPSRLLPTIRSRCRELRLKPLSAADMALALAAAGAEDGRAEALAELAGGSVGRAMRLIAVDGPALYRELLELFGTMPRLDRPTALRIAEKSAARGAEERLEVTRDLLDVAVSRIARAGTGLMPDAEIFQGETDILRALAPDHGAAQAWAGFQNTARARLDHGRAVNVDAQSLLTDFFLAANAVARHP
ncbi:DNA polymerase III subunit delta' [Alphaproteobacteria bacterium GH1-50]|uniref:DNA polymerase III subunit delta n=1 Tax=Kangsaoukella pontilimi TaxID=2691042 RepID=A0A7C9MIV7_9RHOB|nr:DNA polymerase III subunit delta' [Kangsaoukella pontilimi]MXQ07275.1 DNA polymerase III subunit delta' [Kangsaoukella pontilimi]